jgi:hypothetical protein
MGTWRDGSPVLMGREPGVVQQLDTLARQTIRSFTENHRIGVTSFMTRKLWNVLSPERVRNAIKAAKENL